MAESGLILARQSGDIATLIGEGDPVVGWRGDPTMDPYLMPNGEVHVYGFDAHGERYLAAATDARLPGWQHDLLRRLRDGDWQNGNAHDRVEALNAAVEKEAQYRADQATEAFSEKLAWATRRDIGAHFGGLTKEFY
jgi:hypothetical protein